VSGPVSALYFAVARLPGLRLGQLNALELAINEIDPGAVKWIVEVSKNLQGMMIFFKDARCFSKV